MRLLSLLTSNLFSGPILTFIISYDVWVDAFPQEYVGTDVVKTASRLLPRSVFQNDTLRNKTWAAYKDAVDQVSRTHLTTPVIVFLRDSHNYRVSSSPVSTLAVLVSLSTHQRTTLCSPRGVTL